MTRPDLSCVDPSEITDNDLIAYTEREASALAKSHIERCSFCGGRMRAYAQTTRLLHVTLDAASCIPSTRLGDYVLGLLDPEAMRDVATHLIDCRRCQEDRRQLSAFLNEPDDVFAEPGVLASLRRLLAVAQPRPATLGAVRGSTGTTTTYKADDWLLHIELQAAGRRGGKVMAGLVEQPSGSLADSVVRLFRGDAVTHTQEVSDLGDFILSEIPAGSYRLELTSGDEVIVIEPLNID